MWGSPERAVTLPSGGIRWREPLRVYSAAMSYPGQFLRLVIAGSLYTDIFNTSLNFVPTPQGATTIDEPDDALLALIAPVLENWWNDTVTVDGPGIIVQAQLRSFKLNRIGPDGRYVDPVTHEHIYPAPILGAVNSQYPPQLSPAVSLRTAVERGLASKGRMYLPPVGSIGQLGADGRLAVGQAEDIATSVRRLAVELNTAMNTWGGGGTASPVIGIASSVGAGAFRIVNRIACGRVVDTIRSRRNALDEDYQEAADLP